MQELLQYNGLEVVAKNRATEALELYKTGTENIDMIITDLRMPEMSGQLFMIEVRKFEKEASRPRVPILVLTAEASPAERVACLSQYGADDYLLKPIKLQDLMNSVEKILTHKNRKLTRKILLIDDDGTSRRIIAHLIRQNGDSSACCTNIEEAKKEFSANYAKYDAIFLDNLLPDGTGLDFMEHYAKVLEGKPKIPVVSMSGNSQHDQESMYRGYRIYTFLEKPITKRSLLDVIKSIR